MPDELRTTEQNIPVEPAAPELLPEVEIKPETEPSPELQPEPEIQPETPAKEALPEEPLVSEEPTIQESSQPEPQPQAEPGKVEPEPESAPKSEPESQPQSQNQVFPQDRPVETGSGSAFPPARPGEGALPLCEPMTPLAEKFVSNMKDWRGRLSSAYAQKRQERERRLERVLKIAAEGDGKVSSVEVRRVLRCARRTAYDYLHDLEKQGRLKRIGGPNKSIYELVK